MQSDKAFLCSELVSIAPLSGRRTLPAFDGNLEEINERSALVLTQDAVGPGTRVRVKRKATELIGFVRSCTFDNLLGYFIDIDLDLESRWSEKWFIPEHLFALCPAMRYFTEGTSKVPEEMLPAKHAHAWSHRMCKMGSAGRGSLPDSRTLGGNRRGDHKKLAAWRP
jgi:hypothetical protein